MISIENLIAELKDAVAPSRRLDAFIARSVGWRLQRSEHRNPSSGETEMRFLWVVPNSDEYGKVPRYTASLQEAFDLAHSLLPNHVAAIVWEGERARAVIDRGPACHAATPAIALCLAALSAMR